MKSLIVFLTLTMTHQVFANINCGEITSVQQEMVEKLDKAIAANQKVEVFNLLKTITVRDQMECRYYFMTRVLQKGWPDLKNMILRQDTTYYDYTVGVCEAEELLSRAQTLNDLRTFRSRTSKWTFSEALRKGDGWCGGRTYAELDLVEGVFQSISLSSTVGTHLAAIDPVPKQKISNEDSWSVYGSRLLQSILLKNTSVQASVGIAAYANGKLDKTFGTNGSVTLSIPRSVIGTKVITFEKYGFFYVVVNVSRHFDDSPNDSDLLFKVSLDGKTVTKIEHLPGWMAKEYSLDHVEFDGDENTFVSVRVGSGRSYQEMVMDKDLKVVKVNYWANERNVIRNVYFHGSDNKTVLNSKEFAVLGRACSYCSGYYYADVVTGADIFKVEAKRDFDLLGASANQIHYVMADQHYIYDRQTNEARSVGELPYDFKPLSGAIAHYTQSDSKFYQIIPERNQIKVFDFDLNWKSELALDPEVPYPYSGEYDPVYDLYLRPISDGVFISTKTDSGFVWDAKNKIAVEHAITLRLIR